MKNLIVLLIVLLTIGCSSDKRERIPQHTQQRESYAEPIHHAESEMPIYNAMDGLDLTRLLRLAKESSSARKLERTLNSPFSPNNLDLNGDGQTDFIHVRGYGSGIRTGYGFSLFTIPSMGERQPIATIEVSQNYNYPDKVNVSVTGNENLYGHGVRYNASYYKRNIMLWAYLIGRPSPYHRDYSYNSYPTYYTQYVPVPVTKYRTRTKYISKVKYVKVPSSKFKPSELSKKSNPNYGKSASVGIKRKLSNPTSTQKRFLVRNKSKVLPKKMAFGKKNKSPSNKNKISLVKKTSPPAKKKPYGVKPTTRNRSKAVHKPVKSRKSSFGSRSKPKKKYSKTSKKK
jgi:hypothetical protein